MPTRDRIAIRCVIALLAVLSVVVYAHGLRTSWLWDRDGDMQARLEEYRWFRQGVYPTRPLEPEVPRDTDVPYTVYPPYGVAMFTPFFEPGGKLQGRIVIQALSAVGLGLIAAYGYRLLRPAGIDVAVLGAMAIVAIPGNGTALAVGQFSIICVGAIMLQMLLLDRGRPLAAGACWAVAMLKPQVGLAFAALFLVRREWRGLAVGCGTLAALSLVACWWTDVSPAALVHYWLFRIDTRFAATWSATGRVAEAIGATPRIVHMAAAALLVLMPLLMLRGRQASRRMQPDTLTVAAVAGLLGSVLLYHRAYDHLMMFPLLLLAFDRAARTPTRLNVAVAAALGLSLWLPQKLVQHLPLEWLLRPAVWTVCAAVLLARHTRTDSAPAHAGDGAAALPARISDHSTTTPNATEA